MDAKLQRRVQRYGWDAAAKTYDTAWRENLGAAHSVMFEMARLASREAVLDVACGSGFLTFPVAQITGPGGRVMATDISEEMVALVTAAAKAQGFPTVSAARMDAEQLDLADASFDAALCGLGLMYVPEPLNALMEMHRVLRTGGRAVAAVWGERRNCGWAEVFPIVDSVVQSDVCPLFFRLGTGHVLAEEFRTAGFAEIEERKISATSAFGTETLALTALLDGGPVALAAKRFTPEIRLQVEDLLLKSIAAYRTVDGGYDIPGDFVVVSGTTE